MSDAPSQIDETAAESTADAGKQREPRAPFIAFLSVMIVMAVLNFWPRKHSHGVQPGTRATAVGLPWTYWEKGIFPVNESLGTGTITTRVFPLWFLGDAAMAVVIASLAATSAWYMARSSEESGIREAETVEA